MIRPLETAAEPSVPYEVINGEVVLKPMSTYENVIAGLLFSALCRHPATHDVGRPTVEVMFHLPNLDQEYRPDVAFVSYDRWPQTRGIPRTNAWPVVPDLAVEVISPTDNYREVIDRMGTYFDVGVRLVWLIVPGQNLVFAHTSRTGARILGHGDELAGDPVIPGFRIPVADLFPPPDDPPA